MDCDIRLSPQAIRLTDARDAPATKSSGPPTSNTRSFAKQSRKRVRAKRHIPRRRRREAVGYKGCKAGPAQIEANALQRVPKAHA